MSFAQLEEDLEGIWRLIERSLERVMFVIIIHFFHLGENWNVFSMWLIAPRSIMVGVHRSEGIIGGFASQ